MATIEAILEVLDRGKVVLLCAATGWRDVEIPYDERVFVRAGDLYAQLF